MKSDRGFSRFSARNLSSVAVLITVRDEDNYNPASGDHLLHPGESLAIAFEGDSGRWFDWSWTATNVSTGEMVSGGSGAWPQVTFRDSPAATDDEGRTVCWGTP